MLPAGDNATSHAVRGTDDRPEMELIDFVGLDREAAIPKLTALAAASDLILWVTAANDGARDLDRRLIDAVRALRGRSEIESPAGAGGTVPSTGFSRSPSGYRL